MHEATGENCKSLKYFKKQHIERVLQMAGYDLRQTAQLLETPVQELHRLMRELKIPEDIERLGSETEP